MTAPEEKSGNPGGPLPVQKPGGSTRPPPKPPPPPPPPPPKKNSTAAARDRRATAIREVVDSSPRPTRAQLEVLARLMGPLPAERTTAA